MTSALLSADREPLFAQLVTDPASAGTPSGRSFAEIGAELLAPHSYGERHQPLVLPGVECAACAPFQIAFQATRTGAVDPEPAEVPPIEGMVVKTGKRRREVAKQFGPAPKSGRH